MSDSFRKRFLDKVCPWDSALSILFGVNVVLLVMLGLTVALGPQEEGTAVVTGLAFGLICLTLLITVPLLRACQARAPDE